ncbi:uncharacterized protein LAESUDRAFT_633309, partial [Laetiporus sulphureus 93-53]
LAYDQVKCRITNIMGIHALKHDMCINSCLAFTGPFENDEVCHYCDEPHYDMK